MGLTQSVSASEVAQRTQVSIEEAEELLAAFTKHGGTGTHIGLDTFKQVLSDTQHLYDSPAFSPEAADLYFQIFDTTHDGLSTCSPKGWSSRPVNQKNVRKLIDSISRSVWGSRSLRVRGGMLHRCDWRYRAEGRTYACPLTHHKRYSKRK